MRARGWSLVLAGLFGVVLSPFHEHVGAQSGVGVPRVVISEYRFRGPSGSSDEFVELFNQGSADADIRLQVVLGVADVGPVQLVADQHDQHDGQHPPEELPGGGCDVGDSGVSRLHPAGP